MIGCNRSVPSPPRIKRRRLLNLGSEAAGAFEGASIVWLMSNTETTLFIAAVTTLESLWMLLEL